MGLWDACGPPDGRPRTVVAMSGGVDSSVAAVLCVAGGHQVVGVTLRLFCYGEEGADARERSCCSWDAVEDARAVCRRLGIPHHVLDAREAFQEAVIADFVGAYRAGATPNPCVRCNTYLKFRDLLARALSWGTDFLATGHYARLRAEGEGSSRPQFALLRGVDRHKDQSYFLWGLDQRALARTLFPIGDLTKEEVRQRAEREGLLVARKPESQEICFVPSGDYRDFLRSVGEGAGLEPGPIVDLEGRRIGGHQGTALFTIGQRRGLGIAASSPLYVVDIRPETATVVAGPAEALRHREAEVSAVHWIAGAPPPLGRDITVKIRHLHPGAPAQVVPEGDRAHVIFHEPQWAITPGQSAVFYDGEECLGGGVIVRGTGGAGTGPRQRREERAWTSRS